MGSVFVSHSKYDVDIVNYFAKVFARLKLQASFMELEDLAGKYQGARISEIIRSKFVEDTKAVIVLLGKNLERPPTPTPQYTHNWVNFEVGVASGSNKPVWVFEKFDEFIDFPIPYVTDYCQYTLEDTEQLRAIGNILETMYQNNTIVNPPRIVKCHLCNATYRQWNSSQPLIRCPVCRQPTMGSA